MRIIDVPELPPGACFLTGTSTGPFVDTMLDIDDLANHGRIYLAVSTLDGVAQLLGYAPPVAWQRARAEITELRDEVAGLVQQIESLTSAHEVLLGARAQSSLRAPEPPAGSVAIVLDWVQAAVEGERRARAESALAAERLEQRPRVSLIRQLEAILEEIDS